MDTSNNPPSQHAASSPKRVSFQDFVRFKYTPRVDDMTEEEINETWFSAEEFNNIRVRERTLLIRITEESNESLKREDYLNSYGLESSESRKQRRIRSNEGRACVLLEQELQFELQEFDAEKLGQQYHSVTCNAAIAARKRAAHMEQGVQLESTRELQKKKKAEYKKRNQQDSTSCSPKPRTSTSRWLASGTSKEAAPKSLTKSKNANFPERFQAVTLRKAIPHHSAPPTYLLNELIRNQ